MQKRKLGKSGLEVSPLAFGGNVFGWTVDEATSFRLLDAYVAAGGNFIDTADVYSSWVPGNRGGESETIIGNWVKRRGNRNRVVIATKVGWDMGDNKKGLGKAYILQAVEDSLKRLQTEYFSLARGFLTGKYRSEADLAKSQRGQGVRPYLNPRGFRILAALDKIAAQYQSSPAAICVAWLLARPSVTAPIASATTLEQLGTLVAGARLRLDRPALDLLNQASA